MTPLRSFICLLAAASLPAISLAQSVNHQSPSEQISVGTLSIIASPAASVAASAEGSDPAAALVSIAGVGSVLVVTGITEAGKDAFDVLLEGSRQAGKASLKVTRGAVEAVGLSVGATVNVGVIVLFVLNLALSLKAVTGRACRSTPATVGRL